MMGVKEELSKQITKINIKTSTFLEENKIKTYIETLKKEIQVLFCKIGEQSFELWRNQTEIPETENPLLPFFEEIQSKYNTIQEQEKLLQELAQRNSQVLGEKAGLSGGERKFCPNCGNECQIGANFCKRCGTKLG